MNFVWPITALYSGPLGLRAYCAIDRKAAKPAADTQRPSRPAAARDHHPAGAGTPGRARRPAHAGQPVSGRKGGAKGAGGASKPLWQSTLVGATHCGAGCTLGDIGGEWTVFWAGWTIAGASLWAKSRKV
jgi:hypothetical protein